MSRLRRRHPPAVPELNVTAFMNLMVVLIPFLLITAVFTRITWLEMNLPAPPAAVSDPPKQITLIVRQGALELRSPDGAMQRLPRTTVDYPYARLRERLLALKTQTPDIAGVLMLLEPELRYGELVDLMDVVRVQPQVAQGQIRYLPLYPDIAFGDAPAEVAP